MEDRDIPKGKKDTTSIPTPYKVKINNGGNSKTDYGDIQEERNNGSRLAKSDTSQAKISYNSQVVRRALGKRNSERKDEGKKPITAESVFGSNRGVESTKGKTFKEDPLPIKKN